MKLFETICSINGSPLHLAWHEDRIRRTLGPGYPGQSVKILGGLDEVIKSKGSMPGRWRIRVDYHLAPGIQEALLDSISCTPYVAKIVKSLILVDVADLPWALNYPFKFADRRCFDTLAPGMVLAPDEEILYHRKGIVLEGRYANLILAASTNGAETLHCPREFLHQGTTRSRLLANSHISETTIKVDDLKYFDWVGFVNAMLGPGEIRIDPRNIRPWIPGPP